MGFIRATAWSIISFEFMGFLLVALSLAPIPCLYAGTKKGLCSYTLEVKTACPSILQWKPGTRNHVRVRFMDKNGGNVTIDHLKDPFEVHGTKKSKPFKSCATANFSINGPCLKGALCSLQFKVEGDDDWKVDYAQVHGQNVSPFRCSYHVTLPAKNWSPHDLSNLKMQSASTPQALIACGYKNENGKMQDQTCLAKAPKGGKANC